MGLSGSDEGLVELRGDSSVNSDRVLIFTQDLLQVGGKSLQNVGL